MNPNSTMNPSLQPLMRVACGLTAALILTLAGTPLAAQTVPTAEVRAGKKRPMEFLATLEAQTGGDELAALVQRTCIDGVCTTYEDTLNAGDGLGGGFGILLPLGSTRADVEFVFGATYGSLSLGGQSNSAFVSRYFVRSQIMFNTYSGFRIGGGLVAHMEGKYKIYEEGLARRFDSALGVRFQTEWDIAPDVGLGFYLQGMEYSTGNVDSIDANSLGFVTTFRFR